MTPAPSIKDRDLELWMQWKRTKSPADLEALMHQMKGPITNQVNRWASVAPRFLLENQAKALALQAFENYDPKAGTALASYVMTWLQKLSRTAYEHQSVVTIPEHKRLTFNRFTQLRSRLEDDLGHAPTMQHMADHMGMPVAKLQALVDDVQRREYLESEEHPDIENSFDEQQRIHAIVHDMTPLQQKIFKWKTGYEGTPIKANAAIMAELKLTQGQLSYELTKIKTLLAAARKVK